MKAQFTFEECGKIFQAVARIEAKFETLEKAKKEHNDLSLEFDTIFAELNYSFSGASDYVHELFERKCTAMDAEEKAEKAARKAVKDFGKMIGLGMYYDDLVEYEVKRYIDKGYNELRMVKDVKYLAKEAARRIEY